MERRTFNSTNIKHVVSEISEWLGCQNEFITSSFNSHVSTDTRTPISTGTECSRTRYFERYQQRHATITITRTELHMSELIQNWIKNVKIYPPSEIFFEKYGKEAKAEKRIQDVCEDLYRFCYPEGQVNVLSELSTAYRDLEVLSTLGFDDIKSECIITVTDKFLKYAKEACAELEKMHKKDQLLNEYYKSWKVKYQDISTEIYNMTKEFK